MDLRTLAPRFRDDAQRRAARGVVHDRLADDRAQQECRTLMRFAWQLCMPYTEVTVDELEAYVSAAKLAVVHELIAALQAGPADVDAWIARYAELPEIEDRGFWESRGGRDGGHDDG